jgi:RNA polymerase sigma-70 factor (ECF subfamily)
MATPDKESLRTRASLIEKLGDFANHSGWREFFDTYWGLIYGVARKAGLSDADAQDVVQDTMSCVARQMPTFRYDPAKGSFKAWLLTLTRWRIVDRLRKRPPAQKDPPPEASTGTDSLAQIPDPASLLPDAVWEKEWETNLYQAALANLRRKVDPQKFQIFDLYVTREWPAEKVAERFQVAIEQVYLAKHRITEMLKAEVQRLERDSF